MKLLRSHDVVIRRRLILCQTIGSRRRDYDACYRDAAFACTVCGRAFCLSHIVQHRMAKKNRKPYHNGRPVECLECGVKIQVKTNADLKQIQEHARFHLTTPRSKSRV